MESPVIIKNYIFGEMESEDIIQAVLTSRGITDIGRFLEPDEDLINPPESLPNIFEAGMIVQDALNNGKKIFLNVDSDTDGVTSGAIIKRYIDYNWNIDIPWHISKGKSHGTSEELTEKLKNYQPDVLIIVDSLDGDTTNYKLYADMGIKVVVLDHHDVNPEIDYAKYITLVSSNLSSNSELSGAGVCWKFCKYLDSLTRNNYADELCDLASVGIIADMVDVSEQSLDNRALIAKGFRNLKNPMIKKIIGSFPFNAQSVSFSIAPLINACCRYSKNESAFKAFITDDPESIKRSLKVMNHWKKIQNEEVNEIYKGLVDQLEDQKNEKVLLGFIDTKNGISGLVANKILAHYKKPVLIFKKPKDQSNNCVLIGSGRGLGKKNFREACMGTNKAQAYGHPHAFGIFLESDNLEDFLKDVRTDYKDETFNKDLVIDIGVNPEDINNDLVNAVKSMNTISSTGFGAIQVASIIEDYTVSTMSEGKHLVFKDDYFTYIQWNGGSQQACYEMLAESGTPLMLSGTLDSGFFGRKYVPRMIINNIVAQHEVM